MKKIVFATNNAHKLKEIKSILKEKFEILSLNDIGYNQDIPETGDTLALNASIKSHTIYNEYGLDCFSDDTGLEVDALDGKPGVYSARYAGEDATYDQNVDKLLTEMDGEENRSASFSTVISLIIGGEEFFFTGKVEGEITLKRYGLDGFGYDPIFRPDGFSQTFSEMTSDLKNKISHRARATEKLVKFLSDFTG